MTRPSTGLACLAVALWLAPACATDEPGLEDGEHDSFGSGKADGGFDPDSVEARGVLAAVNESWVDADLLHTDGQLSSRAARNIIAHRDGADGVFGTADDDPFDTLAELDAVPFVGPVTLRALAAFAESNGFVKRWTSLASMSTERSYFGAVRGPDDRIYAIGGPRGVSAEAYSPATNTWAPVAEMPTPRYALGVTLGADGRIYAIGGYNSNGDRAYQATVEAYTPSTNSWETLASMPTARALLSAVTGADGRIYAIGGFNEAHGTLSLVEAYTPSTNSWARVASMPSARYDLATAAGDDGRIYAFGGTINNAGLATVEAYTPSTNSWKPAAPMRLSREGLAATVGTGGLIYVLGGDEDNGVFPSASVPTFLASTGAWSGVQSMTTGRSHLAAAAGADGRIYVLGGYEPAGGEMATVEAFTPPATP
jgi:N-acetylneuraminic acid mutarotase